MAKKAKSKTKKSKKSKAKKAKKTKKTKTAAVARKKSRPAAKKSAGKKPAAKKAKTKAKAKPAAENVRAIVENLGTADGDTLQAVADALKGQFKGAVVLGGVSNGAGQVIYLVRFVAHRIASRVPQNLEGSIGRASCF